LKFVTGLEAPRSIPLEAPPDVSRERFMRPEDVPVSLSPANPGNQEQMILIKHVAT